ncbi:MAG: putative Zn-dependent protease [Planctomycetota bacterium]|jgi:predicted Zn-dependent protease
MLTMSVIVDDPVLKAPHRKRPEMPSIFLKSRSNAFRIALYPLAVIAVAVLVYLGWVNEPEPEIGSRLSSAGTLAQSGAYNLAEEQLVAIFDAEPNNRHAWLLQGLIDERRNDHQKAIQSYRAALKVTDEPELARDIHLSIADLFRRLENHDAARGELATVESTSGKSVATQRLRGIIAWSEGNYDAARTRFGDAKKLDPTNLEVDSLKAGTLIEEARHAEALTVLKKIPDDEKSAWPYWQTLARSCMESGDNEGAKKALAKFVQLDQRGKVMVQNDEFWNQHTEATELGELLND